MKDNPKAADQESHRRKIVDDFKLDISNCILCGLCVEFCNFDAIIMSDFHEEGSLTRIEQDLPLVTLLDMGKEMQDKGKFTPPPPKKRPASKATKEAAANNVDTEKQES
tara:strand:+ start:277 stop:603 length:327 start_codon:yes stop_codon:yes gene_type:complete